jgi:chromosome segregation ATPase
MAAPNILVEVAHNQDIKVLKQKNIFLGEQLTSLKAQIKDLEGEKTRLEDHQKKYADTLLTINRIWQQLNGDITALCKRVGGPAVASAAADAAEAVIAAGEQADAAAAAAAAAAAGGGGGGGGDPAEEQQQLQLAWDSYDPYLARLLQGDAASSARGIKKNAREYVADLSTAEQALHCRAAASLAALSTLLDAIAERHAAAAAAHEQLRAQAGDEGLRAANASLHEEVAELSEQLDAANALHRSAQVNRGAGGGVRGGPLWSSGVCAVALLARLC